MAGAPLAGGTMNLVERAPVQCKKQTTLGKEALSDADCRAKLKRWLLAGLSHPDGSRSWHVNLDARQLAGSSREDLDAEFGAKLSA